MADISRRDFAAVATGAAVLTTLPIGGASAQTAPAGQVPGFYKYRVGEIIVTAVNDGAVMRPNLEGLVRNVATADVQRALEASFVPTSPMPNFFTTAVLEMGNRLVLLDTAFADNGMAGTGVWMRNFRAAGYDPARVTDILITHFHGDHIGGIRNRAGELMFPNAQIQVPAPEWDFWMSDENMNRVAENARGGFMNARRVFAPIAANVRRFTPGGEVLPGVTSIATHGHSPGHTCFVVSSGQGRLLFAGDVVTVPALFVRNPDWSPFFDMNEEQGRAQRRRILDMAATERLLMQVYHAPFPASGHALRDGNGYQWVPAPWNPVI